MSDAASPGVQTDRAPLLAVVLPVYNEAENIATCLRKLYAALRELPHVLLVCYDFDGDSTLPAIRAMPDCPPTLQLVRNSLGRGVAHALQAGFDAALAAGADVIVTSMADLSDPPEVIPAMAARIRAGAGVVSGSRYMRGGSQSGGPFLKRTLSRIAGVSLYWVAGLPTHDATTNFRAYSAAFLRATRVRSRHGFEVALELTTRAHRQGFLVAEVPSSWHDRSAGQSRFRLWKWMPRYFYWYAGAMAASPRAWGILVVLVAATAFAGWKMWERGLFR
ncbi:MAG: glycosyltransferase [Planctomycetes bacterium]|nr:glycosyltransferase [Planctomycetota bacterium]